MFVIIGIMLSGVALGYLLHRTPFLFIQHVITALIWSLLFLLGIEVGSNEPLVRALPTLGIEAVALTVAALLGSLVCAWALWFWLYRGARKKEASHIANVPQEKSSSPLKGSLIIVSFFIVGAVFGYIGWCTRLAQSDFSFFALCGLMFSVGFSMGNDPATLRNFRTLNPRLILLPILTIVGTLLGCALFALFISKHSLTDCLAVGSGFGYYSLSSIFITQYKGAELGTIALLSNISREIITLLLAPLMVRWFGRLAPISAGGATTMDTTLPIITRCSGQEFVVLSIFHGFVVDFSVPFLVTFFCSF